MLSPGHGNDYKKFWEEPMVSFFLHDTESIGNEKLGEDAFRQSVA
jgi:hypothetical protein